MKYVYMYFISLFDRLQCTFKILSSDRNSTYQINNKKYTCPALNSFTAREKIEIRNRKDDPAKIQTECR